MKIAMFRWLAPAFLVAVCSASLAQTAAGKRADQRDPFDVLLVAKDGSTRVFNSYR
jgi:hypothetical protein